MTLKRAMAGLVAIVVLAFVLIPVTKGTALWWLPLVPMAIGWVLASALSPKRRH